MRLEKSGWTKHYDLEEPQELCDLPEFRAFADKVVKLIKKPMTRNEIRSAMGECRDGWLEMALDVWNTDVLEQVQCGGFRKYKRKDRMPLKLTGVENYQLFPKRD